jgi:hypothetical protein
MPDQPKPPVPAELLKARKALLDAMRSLVACAQTHQGVDRAVFHRALADVRNALMTLYPAALGDAAHAHVRRMVEMPTDVSKITGTTMELYASELVKFLEQQ